MKSVTLSSTQPTQAATTARHKNIYGSIVRTMTIMKTLQLLTVLLLLLLRELLFLAILAKKSANDHDTKCADSEREPKAERRQAQLEPSLQQLHLQIHLMFDGGSRGNPGLAGTGASITLLDKSIPSTKLNSAFRRVIYIREYLGATQFTNNEAEYQGLIRALIVAQSQAIEFVDSLSAADGGSGTCTDLRRAVYLVVQCDSNLILKQVTGEYQCKSVDHQSKFEHVNELCT